MILENFRFKRDKLEQLKSDLRHREERSLISDRPLFEYENLLGISIQEMRGKRILDIGSGLGETFSKEAAREGVEVVSMSPSLLKRISRHEKFLKDWQKHSVAGRAQEMPFPDNTFDYELAMFSVPLHLPFVASEYKKFIGEILRTLKPSGKAYIAPIVGENIVLLRPILEKLKSKMGYEFISRPDARLVLTKK